MATTISRPEDAPQKVELRELAFTERDYQRIREIAKSRFGLELGERKRALVYGRLARRLRKLGLHGFKDYMTLIDDPSSDESRCLINALTTNVTHFFRENHHFDLLAREVLPAFFQANNRERRLRLWSAGCSTGEEAYSLGMIVREAIPTGALAAAARWDAKILATDIDSDVLERARTGVYEVDKAEHLSSARIQKHFQPVGHEGERLFQVADPVRQLITFNELNLLDPWPMKGRFDAIFCRNVVIYFDLPTKAALVRRFRQFLKPGGYLFLGHSESLVAETFGLRTCGRTAYRRDDEAQDEVAASSGSAG